MQKHHRFLIVLLLLLSHCAVGQLSDTRKRELDSIATFIPKVHIRNLDSIHAYLHNAGVNEEERIWLFYGYLGIHFTYDNKRKNDQKAPVFTPQYTAQRRKGVCRDYTRVFMYLCNKSGIRNMEVLGRAPMTIWDWISRKLHRTDTRTNHVWNVVYYNNAWHLMDPTWTHVKEREKNKRYNAKTKLYEPYTIKIPSRTYYDVEPKVMMKNHAPNHPAFLLSDSVPTFKTVRKKEKRQKTYRNGYDYNAVLDSLSSYEFPKFTTYYDTACTAYCKRSDLRYEFTYQLSLPTGKQARYFQPTLAYYDERIAFAKTMNEYLKQHAHTNFDGNVREFELAILKLRGKLEKKLAEEAKRKKKK